MLTRRLYTVIENEQSVLVCANITGAVLDLDSTLIISSTIQDITTSGNKKSLILLCKYMI